MGRFPALTVSIFAFGSVREDQEVVLAAEAEASLIVTRPIHLRTKRTSLRAAQTSREVLVSPPDYPSGHSTLPVGHDPHPPYSLLYATTVVG